MQYSPYTAGKIVLNQFIQRVEKDEFQALIHYWGENPKHLNTVRHQHTFWEVCYVLEGEGGYVVDGCYYPLRRHTLFLTPPHTVHQIKSTKGLHLIYVALEFQNNSIDHSVKTFSFREWVCYLENENEYSYMWKSLMLMASNEQTSIQLVHQMSILLLQTIFQAFFQPTPFDKKREKTPIPPIVHQAILYIRDNIDQSLKLHEVADYLHISERHLSRLFKESIQETFSDYVRTQKVQYSSNLLKTTTMSVKDIAQAAGFTSVHYFTRVFTQLMNIAPGQFRAMYTSNAVHTYSDEDLRIAEIESEL